MSTPPPSQDRKLYGVRLSERLMREIKHLAVDESRPMNELAEEALRDLLKKYREKRKEGR
jgi:predicted transcriptional regulator